MDAWGPSGGEAIHTQTFMGNPMGCAMALATMEVLERRRLPERAARVGARFALRLASVQGVREVRGRGLMLAAVLRRPVALAVSWGMLRRGFICLPTGEQGDAIQFTPPLTVAWRQLDAALAALADCLGDGS